EQKIAWTGEIFGPPVDAPEFALYQDSNGSSKQDVGSFITDVSMPQMFVDGTTRDYRLAGGSPAIDSGVPLTFAIGSGNNATRLHVDRASYFQDGYCTAEECLIAADRIRINNTVVEIVPGGIDDANNEITLAEPVSWSDGDPVTLDFKGSAPDM